MNNLNGIDKREATILNLAEELGMEPETVEESLDQMFPDWESDLEETSRRWSNIITDAPSS